ncbi:MAG TPA: GNVR domain-containing protein, partial [Pyrinomonadaceae bacterium]|nr:GNVR domain-containing protein [Pyrinomonadaceae bacterium]
QVVMSRSTLEPLIVKYNLYQRERLQGDAMEELVDYMKMDVKVEVDKSRNDVTNAFRISYRERTPDVVKAVTAELASKYVTAQMSESTEGTQLTKQFFEEQLREAKNRLDEIDQRRIQYMTEHSTSMPNTEQALVMQLNGLREQQKALIAEAGRMSDQRSLLTNQLNDLQQQSENQRSEQLDEMGVKNTPAYAQLRQQKATLEAEYQDMLQTLRPANPDVKKKQAEIKAVQKAMDDMVSEAQARDETRRRRIESTPDLRITGLKSEIQRAEGEITRAQQQLDENNRQIADIEQRLNSVPGAQIGLEALNREYDTAKKSYDDLLEKQRKADMAADVATNAQGEAIQVIDPANLPQQPIAPKRMMLILLGMGAGLGVGFVFAGCFEVPRLLTIQTRDDVRHYTGLPMLVEVPELLTPKEAKRIPRRRRLLLAAGVVATVVAIPVLAFVLRYSHFFDRFS